MTVSPPPIPIVSSPPPLPLGKDSKPVFPRSVQVCWALGIASVTMTGILTGLPAVVLGHWLLHGPQDATEPPLSPAARKRVLLGLGLGYGGIVLTVILVGLFWLLIVLWRQSGILDLL
jgi:hypothetical protein